MTTRTLIVLLFTFGSTSVCPALADLIVLSPVADRGGNDVGRDGTWDSLQPADDVVMPVGLGTNRTDRRAAMEFDLSAIPSGAVITSATFSTSSLGYGGVGGLNASIYLAGYAADGVIDLSDMARTDIQIGGPLEYRTSPVPTSPPEPLLIDVTGFVQSQYSSEQYVGLLLWGVITNSFGFTPVFSPTDSFSVQFLASEAADENYTGEQPPILEIEFQVVPEVNPLFMASVVVLALGLGLVRRRAFGVVVGLFVSPLTPFRCVSANRPGVLTNGHPTVESIAPSTACECFLGNDG